MFAATNGPANANTIAINNINEKDNKGSSDSYAKLSSFLKLEEKVRELTERFDKHQEENKEALRIMCEAISQ